MKEIILKRPQPIINKRIIKTIKADIIVINSISIIDQIININENIVKIMEMETMQITQMRMQMQMEMEMEMAMDMEFTIWLDQQKRLIMAIIKILD